MGFFNNLRNIGAGVMNNIQRGFINNLRKEGVPQYVIDRFEYMNKEQHKLIKIRKEITELEEEIKKIEKNIELSNEEKNLKIYKIQNRLDREYYEKYGDFNSITREMWELQDFINRIAGNKNDLEALNEIVKEIDEYKKMKEEERDASRREKWSEIEKVEKQGKN